MNIKNLIVITGLPGTGKSTVAAALAKQVSARHLNSDIIRHELGLRGQYDTATKAVVYDALLSAAERYLKEGKQIVVDATFYKKELRQPIIDLAEKIGVNVNWVELKTTEKEIKNRVAKKRKFSEADFDVYLKIKKEYQPLQEPHLEISTDNVQVEEIVNNILDRYFDGKYLMLNDHLINKIIKSKPFLVSYGEAELIETHISWVIIAREFVFKIKKALQFSFLDFSTLEKRKFYCKQEVKLNQRLSKDMYLCVIPIYLSGKNITLEKGTGEIIDYAVKMNRMDHSRQMDELLKVGMVTKKDIERVAVQLAKFHLGAEKISKPINLAALKDDFYDISKTKDFIEINIGRPFLKIIDEAINFADYFLDTFGHRLIERQKLGYFIDGHGDLHSRNIFLLENEAIIFDCIEFNDHFRQVDVLDELAFFCMDLNFNDSSEFEEIFLNKYNQLNNCFLTEEDKQLFDFFKLYRANVRAKVSAINGSQLIGESGFDSQLMLVKKYLRLMEQYMAAIKSIT